MPKYIVKGVEQVYDAFDTWEHDNHMEQIVVNILTVRGAIKKGEKILQDKINEKRKGFTSGWFNAHVEEVYDINGKLLYEDHVKHIE